ncbi:MAG: TolC family protein [Planctomycetota bacterium]
MNTPSGAPPRASRGPAGPRAAVRTSALVATLLVASGCRSYEPRPLGLAAHLARYESSAPLSDEFLERLEGLGPRTPRTFDLADGLTSAEAEVLALFRSPELRVARLEAGVARADAENAGRWQDPVFGFDGARITSPTTSTDLGATLGLTLPVSGRLSALEERADAEHVAALRRVALAEWEARATVRRAWTEWSFELERLSVAEGAVDELAELVGDAEALADAGELSSAESGLLALELAERRAAVVGARASVERARLAVLRAIGLAPTARIDLVPELARSAEDGDVGDAADVLATSPSIAVARAEYEVAERATRLAVRSQYPDVEILGGLGSESDDDRVLFGLSLPIPLWNRGASEVEHALAVREVAGARRTRDGVARPRARRGARRTRGGARTPRRLRTRARERRDGTRRGPPARRLRRVPDPRRARRRRARARRPPAPPRTPARRERRAHRTRTPRRTQPHRSERTGGTAVKTRRNPTGTRALAALALAAALLPAGCGDGHGAGDDHADAAEHTEGAPAITNRVAIPPTVRRNLGITFANVESRRVAQTLRVPGRFEYLPTARSEYRAPVPGRVDLLVEQFAEVEPGAALYSVDSPTWREMQSEIADAAAEIRRLEALSATYPDVLDALAEDRRAHERAVATWRERIGQLEQVQSLGGGKNEELASARGSLADAEASLASTRTEATRTEAERRVTGSGLEAARTRLRIAIEHAAVVTGESPEALAEDDGSTGVPRWSTIRTVVVRAEHGGIVDTLAANDGAWVGEHDAVVSVVRPDRIRFRASALPSDLGALRAGLVARVVAPAPTTTGRAIPMGEARAGALRLDVEADPHDRTIDALLVPEHLAAWARAGVAAHLEVELDSTAEGRSSRSRSRRCSATGSCLVIFRRDPKDPDSVIRVEADLGIDDGRWIEIQSGVRAGDEVVLDGSFQLLLATAGTIPKGGHFHADGTYHEGED